MRAAVAAVLLVAGPLSAEPRTIGFADLRASDDPDCEDWHAYSRTIEMCRGVPTDPEFHHCAAQTRRIEGTVRIVGYAHPVEFEFKDVRRFILVPGLLDCPHPPAPMSNQIILVESETGIDMSFDPVRVTGRIEPAYVLGAGTQIRYRMVAERIDPATKPEVQP